MEDWNSYHILSQVLHNNKDFCNIEQIKWLLWNIFCVFCFDWYIFLKNVLSHSLWVGLFPLAKEEQATSIFKRKKMKAQV